MSEGVVLVIDGDDDSAGRFATALRQEGFQVNISGNARDALTQLQRLPPDCVLCDFELPDIDGYWVVSRVRASTAKLRAVPFVMLMPSGDSIASMQEIADGADAYIEKSAETREVIAQVSALIGMIARLKERESLSAVSANGPTAFRGDLSQMSLGTLLTMLDMERREGTVRIDDEKNNHMVLEIKEGSIVSATVNGKKTPSIDVLRRALGLTGGRFTFQPGEIKTKLAKRQAIQHLMLEAMRLEDEQA